MAELRTRNLIPSLTEIFIILSVIALSIIARLMPHPPNFSPVAAVAVFGGAYLWNKFSGFALLLPLISLFLGDAILGFHDTMAFVYGAIVVAFFAARAIQSKTQSENVILYSLTGSALFFIISNFGVWAVGGLYPQTAEGLVACFIAALPFFHWTILGDLLFLSGFVFVAKKSHTFLPVW